MSCLGTFLFVKSGSGNYKNLSVSQYSLHLIKPFFLIGLMHFCKRNAWLIFHNAIQLKTSCENLLTSRLTNSGFSNSLYLSARTTQVMK